MVTKIQCKTLFDITATGVRNNYKASQYIYDHEGQLIKSEVAWIKARNQQRNWETVNQIMSLRALPERISAPVHRDGAWWFDFEIPNASALKTNEDELGLIKQDAQGVPMIVSLDEKSPLVPYFVIDGKDVNIWFEVI